MKKEKVNSKKAGKANVERKCPVCGKFTKVENIRKYDEVLSYKDRLLAENAQMKSELAHVRRSLKIETSLREKLENVCAQTKLENERLRNRGFFARLLNR